MCDRYEGVLPVGAVSTELFQRTGNDYFQSFTAKKLIRHRLTEVTAFRLSPLCEM